MAEIDGELKKAQEQANLFNSREALFGLPATDYGKVRRMADAFDPFCQFWKYANNWRSWQKEWKSEPFATLNAEEVEKDVGTAFKVMFKMGKAFTHAQAPAERRQLRGDSSRAGRVPEVRAARAWRCARPACATATGRRSPPTPG